jgi:chromosome segregation ATPase
MVDDADKAIEQWQKVHTDRTKYVRKAAIKVTLSSVGVVTGVVSTAGAAASGGYALGVAIYGLAKAVIGMSKQIYSLAIAIDKAEKNLRSDLSGVKKAYLKASQKEVATKEILKSVMARVVSYEMQSISKCEKELDLFVGKLRGIDVKAGDYGKTLHKMLDKQTALDKLIAEKKKKQEQDGQYISKRLPKLEKTLDKLVKSTADQIKTMESLYKRIELGKRNETIYRAALTNLQAKKPEWVKYAEMATALIDIALDASALQVDAVDIGTGIGPY